MITFIFLSIFHSYEFFNDLYHKFLITPKIEMKCMCLQAMSIVYGRYYEDIGPFSDTKYIIQMLEKVRFYIINAKIHKNDYIHSNDSILVSR